jgi:amino acid transporter
VNTPDLDALRGRWAASNTTLDRHLTLDRDAVRAALAGRTARAFRRHSLWLLPGLLLTALALIGLLAFVASHWNDPVYLLAGGALLILAAAELRVDLLQWRTLSRLDFSQPTLQVQATLDALRSRRLWLTKWILLSSVLLWLPGIAVLLKAATGHDLLRSLHISVVLINLAIGVAFIPVALLISRVAMRRLLGDTGMQRFLDDAVGARWTAAQRSWQRQQQADQQIDAGRDPLALIAPLPEAIASEVSALQWRLLVGIVGFAALILAIGMFNAAHAGQWQFLVPGIVLNLLVVAQMVTRILQRLQLGQLHGGMLRVELQQQFVAMLSLRDQLARATLILGPLLLLLLAQVLTRLVGDGDLFLSLGGPWTLALGLIAGLASLALWRKARRAPDRFMPTTVAVLGGLSLRRTRALQAQLADARFGDM